MSTNATSAVPAIEARGLGRQFASKWAVRGLHLAIAPGEIYGFLGPNGAGKTTTIRMLAGMLQPSEGTVRIDGREYGNNPAEVKRVLGLVPDTPPLYDYLTGRQYVALVASLWGVDKRARDERCERLFHQLHMEDAADELCRGYSHGTRKKAHIAAILTTAPRVLLLDEPTTGLDPRSARALKDLMVEESKRGTTILFSTHVLEAAEEICTRVGILDRGSLRAEGTAADLRAQHSARSLEDVFLKLTSSGDGDGTAAS